MERNVNLPLIGGSLLAAAVVLTAATNFYLEEENPGSSVVAETHQPSQVVEDSVTSDALASQTELERLDEAVQALTEQVQQASRTLSSSAAESRSDTLASRIAEADSALAALDIRPPPITAAPSTPQQARISELRQRLQALQGAQ